MLATELALSQPTISRSLRNDPAIGVQTKARVLELAAKLGYQPPSRPRPQSRNRDKLANEVLDLGVICRGGPDTDSIHGQVSHRLLRGVTDATRGKRTILHVEYLDAAICDRLNEAANWPSLLKTKAVSGLIFTYPLLPQAIQAVTREVPCIQFTYAGAGASIDCVTEDNERSMAQLVAHLKSLGHQKIGWADFGSFGPSDVARYRAFPGVLEDHALPFEPNDTKYIRCAVPLEQRAALVARHIARRLREGVRGWICQNDFLGYVLCEQLRVLGVRVPQDVSVCGFDNFDPPRGLPKLTSIDAPFEAMGSAAVRQLVRRITQPHLGQIRTMYASELIEGESTARI